MSGDVVSDSQDFRRLEDIMRGLEKEYGLREVAPSREAQRSAPTKGEIECAVRTGKPSEKMLMQSLVDKALAQGTDYKKFCAGLERQGVSVLPNEASTGRISGISFKHNDITMKGSDLGKGYTWGGLQKRGLYYEQDRHAPKLDREQAGAAVECLERGNGNHRLHSRAESEGRGRIGAITRTLTERHAQNNLRHGAEFGGAHAEQQIHQTATAGDMQDMGIPDKQNGDSGRGNPDRSKRDDRGSQGDTRGASGIDEANPLNRQAHNPEPMDISVGNGGSGVSALDRVRALADAGLRYHHSVPERDIRTHQGTGEESGTGGREEVISQRSEKKKEVDMER